MQQQVAASALLFNTSFRLPENVHMYPLLETFSEQQRQFSFSREQEMLYGDWFSNRSSQGHMLTQTLPTRAEISIDSSAKIPSVISTVNTRIETLAVCIGEGNYYKASSVAPGSKNQLTPMSASEFKTWYSNNITQLSQDILSEKLAGVTRECNFFIGLSPAVSEFTIETLPQVRWAKDNSIVFGFVDSGVPEPSTETSSLPLADFEKTKQKSLKHLRSIIKG